MATYTVINGGDAQLANINAGGTDVEAFSYKNGVTLTDTELGLLLAPNAFSARSDIAVIADLAGDAAAVQKKRSIALAANFLSA